MASWTLAGTPAWRTWVTRLALAGIVALIGACSKFDSAHNGPQMSARFFEAQFKDVNGKIVDLSALRGKTVVVNFWSTWCPPCIEEMPMFNEIHGQWQGKNVAFVGIAADQADNVKAFLKKTPVDYTIVVGGQQSIDLSRTLGNRYDAVPFTLMISPQGNITSRHFGIYTRKDLEADLAKATK